MKNNAETRLKHSETPQDIPKSKNIVIVGGGISGLATLHYLIRKFKQKYDVNIILLEKNATLGGTINSIFQSNCLFESGPNGFLAKPKTEEFMAELNLENDLLLGKEGGKKRFICYKNKLWELPINPVSFFNFPLMTFSEKIRVLKEIFIPKATLSNETVYDFGKRRLGEKFSQFFLDPMIKGVYGGDARQTIMATSFPKMTNLEYTYGSLIKAALKKGFPKPSKLKSLKSGMGQVITKLKTDYAKHIQTNREVRSIIKQGQKYIIQTNMGEIYADSIILSTTAYSASEYLKTLDKDLSEQLNKIYYAPIIVVGLTFKYSDFANIPQGYGYLNVSSENSPILGILFESNVFEHRGPKDQIVLRAMIGGVNFPDVIHLSENEIIKIVITDLKKHFIFSADPLSTFIQRWPKGIPQYNIDHAKAIQTIDKQLKINSNLFLVANYWNGISFNDCIQNAYSTVEGINL